ncbi:MAG: outer membrane protein TolC [Candidatus Pelagisphaera sp.]|jgi:outer membrane protein TolC
MNRPRRAEPFLFCVSMVFWYFAGPTTVEAAEPGDRTRQSLSMLDFMQLVVEYNDSVQGRMLGFKAARHQRDAEKGTFEPSFVNSTEFVDRDQPNNFQAERSLGLLQGGEEGGYPSIFLERNWTYSSAIEVATPIGTRFRLGMTGREIRNNVPRPAEFLDIDEEFETSVGFSVEQPLLKGLGFAANLASLRLAARQSEIAFQDYRRELMTVVAEAELAYWNMYYAQAEYELSTESVDVAETLLDDSKASLDAGRGSRLDVLEAEAGLAIRESREREAYLKRIEASNILASFFGKVPRDSDVSYVATNAPVSQEVEMLYEAGVEAALVMNPELLRVRLQKQQELIRMGFARNERLPELNVSASYGSTGLGFDWRTSFDDVNDNRFPSWNVGMVLRMPIAGDVRGRNQLKATRLRLMQAERIESNVMTQIRVGCDTAEQRIKSNFKTARSLESVVEFRTNLLETRMEARDVGRMDSRSVLEAEQELFAARLEQLSSENQFQRGLLELQLISGILLHLRDLEMGFQELEDNTQEWIDENGIESTGLAYSLPEFSRLPASAPIQFQGDRAKAPWLGFERSDQPRVNRSREADGEPQRSRRIPFRPRVR